MAMMRPYPRNVIFAAKNVGPILVHLKNAQYTHARWLTFIILNQASGNIVKNNIWQYKYHGLGENLLLHVQYVIKI